MCSTTIKIDSKSIFNPLSFFLAIAGWYMAFVVFEIITKSYKWIKSIIANEFGKAISFYKATPGYLPGSFEVKTMLI